MAMANALPSGVREMPPYFGCTSNPRSVRRLMASDVVEVFWPICSAILPSAAGAPVRSQISHTVFK